MTKETAIKLFEAKQVRTLWEPEQEKWYFSIVDVIAILTGSPNPRNYWKVLKHRLSKEGNQSVTDCNQLKMQSSDGKFYKTDVADTEQLLRLIQSVPSPKAEPFKLWLAKVGYERIEETEDPEKAFDRALPAIVPPWFAIVRLSSNVSGVFSLDISVVVASASMFKTNSRLLILSRRFSFLSSLNCLYCLVVSPHHAWVISSVSMAYS